MEWVETTGRTVEEALDVALDTLGVDEDEADFEVLEEPRGGLWGRREARIRARVRPISRAKPGEGRARPRRSREGGSGRSRRPSSEAVPATTSGGGSSGGSGSRRRSGARGGSRGGSSGGSRSTPAATKETVVSEV